jgi:hypothetical protein
MNLIPPSRKLPRSIWALAVLYCIASLVHFTHNAEYIAFYPNMPAWLTREKVYLVWLAVTGVGAVSVALSLAGWRLASSIGLAMYGTLGFDGLGHYALALCSEHTLAMNLSIWFEVLAGAVLVARCAWFLKEQGGVPTRRGRVAP